MISKVTAFIWLTVLCGLWIKVYADDADCGSDLDLSLTNIRFLFSDDGVTVRWSLRTPTDCAVQYHVTVRDSELGIIRDDYLEAPSATLDAMSPCIGYDIGLRAVNQAIPTQEGPSVTTSIQFFSRVQITPTLKSLDINSTSISTTWFLEGDRNRCPLRNFYVNGGNNFNFTIPLEDLEDRSVVPLALNSLKPDTMYFFQVSVENSAGWSATNQIAVQTLHE